MSMKKCAAAFAVMLFTGTLLTVHSQTTAFTYQGSLKTTGTPANGIFDLQFLLFDAVTDGTQVGATVTVKGVMVVDGIFSASLDFGNQFPGENRYLEIRVQESGGAGFTLLTPRQLVSSVPYSIKSKEAMNAVQLGGIDSTLFVQQDIGGNVSIAGALTIAGTLSANTINAQTQYDLGGQRILGNAGNSNLFVGTGAGAANVGSFHTFVGNLAGNANSTGDANSFFGNTAGLFNATGSGNAFFGGGSGGSNVNGNNNAFFGLLAGFSNTASDNSYFGSLSGQSNTTGDANAFFGTNSGQQNTSGRENASFGWSAGRANAGGVANSIFGSQAGHEANGGSFNSIFGRGAGFYNMASDNAFFGAGAGEQNTAGTNNTFVGTSVGYANLTGNNNSFFGRNAGISNHTGSDNSLFGFQANVGLNNLTNATAIGAGAIVSSSNSLVLGNGANVGIGTSTPQAKFNVVGSSWFQGDTSPLPAVAGKGIIIGFGGEQGYMSAFDYGTFTPKNLLLNNSGGNVGIGTGTPKAKLDVTGGSIIVGSPGQGIIMKSPNGAVCRFLSIDNAGTLISSAIACP